MEVGDYVRTNDRGIRKVGKIIDNLLYRDTEDNLHQIGNLIKSSPNIIDLIEIGDYVNGMKITNIFVDEETKNIELEFNNGSSYLYPKSWNYEARSEKYKIKSIVTKEMFKEMEYKICE